MRALLLSWVLTASLLTAAVLLLRAAAWGGEDPEIDLVKCPREQMDAVLQEYLGLGLEPQKDGGFRFLTSWRCDPPAVPTAYPAWAPELVIPLEGLAPYRAPELQVERRSGDPAGAPSITRFEPEEFLDGGFGVEVFTGLFGQRGLRISYNGWLDERYCGTFTDYYTFADDGAPSLLL